MMVLFLVFLYKFMQICVSNVTTAQSHTLQWEL